MKDNKAISVKITSVIIEIDNSRFRFAEGKYRTTYSVRYWSLIWDSKTNYLEVYDKQLFPSKKELLESL